MKHLKSKISRTLVLYIVLFSSVVTLVLTLIQLRMDYVTGINVIEQRLNQIELTNLDAITQSMWTIDKASIQLQLDGLKRLPDIIRIELTDDNEQFIAILGNIDTEHFIVRDFPIYKIYRGTQIYLGELSIVATKENLYQQLIDTIVVILISQGIKTFLVSLFVLVIFYYLVTRHLEYIAQHATRVTPDSQAESLELNRKTSNLQRDDELDHLIQSINQMNENNFISYQKLIEKQRQLAESEARLSAIFHAMTDGVIFMDNQHNIVLVNPAFCQMLGYAENEVLGQTPEKLYADKSDYDNTYTGSTTSDLDPKLFEIDFRTKDGQEIPCETLCSQVVLPSQAPIGSICVFRDICARKQAEDEHLQLQKQLQQSQKMEAIGHLTGGIAHDFNNILTSILGYADLANNIAREKNIAKLNQYLDHIQSSGQRASELVAQMLAFSRGAPSKPQSIELKELIEESLTMLKPMLPSSIQVDTQLQADAASIKMDKTQLHQVLLNICLNARDAMQGKGKLSISLNNTRHIDSVCQSCHQAMRGDFVELSIRDTGSGIDKNIIDHIFDPFLSTKEIGKGSGMGLSVVHGILHKHHAHILVESETGQGTNFRLLFSPEMQVKQVTEQALDKQSSPNHHQGTGKHILLVDDEKELTAFMQTLLEHYGYEVTTTTDSINALSIIKNNTQHIDLMITDQTMPSMTGLELSRQVHAINPELPIILYSGYSEEINKTRISELGISGYLKKPIDTKKLTGLLNTCLSTK